MKKKAIAKKKRPYIPMEITMVKLNPEQAVLSCCDSVGKAMRAGIFIKEQCIKVWPWSCGPGSFGQSS